MSLVSSTRPAPHAAACNEEIIMKNAFRQAPAFLLLTLTLCLALDTPGWAGSAPPGSATLAAAPTGTEAIPAERLTGSAVEALERLIFRFENVHFNLDSSVLLPAGKRALNRKIAWLAAHPRATVIVEGHCDARGSSAYNLRLGTRRAETVRAYLVEQGIAPRRIQVVSWGKERPEASGSGESAWSRNRRAEFLPR
jgi:peptidoglycan-associated lipoprotein